MDITLISAVPFTVMHIPMGCAAFSASMKRYPRDLREEGCGRFNQWVRHHVVSFKMADFTVGREVVWHE
jgi:hypothetical protein